MYFCLYSPTVLILTHPITHADLSEDERGEIERQVAPIEDQKLREALENAMRASAEWAKGVQSEKEP